MGDRLTNKWTPTLEEAFGERGKRGFLAEQYVYNTIKSWGWDVKWYQDDQEKQNAGVDLAIRKPGWSQFYTVDVKGNMRDDMSFFIEVGPKGWLLSPRKRSDRIWHVNINTGNMAWYDRGNMSRYIIKYHMSYDKDALWLCRNDGKLPFITWRVK